MGLTFNLGRVSPSVFTDSSLNVGIGAAPSGTYKLEVTGTAKVSTSAYFAIASGSVGIGTITPTSYFYTGNGLAIYNATQNTLSIATDTSGTSSLYFSNGASGAARYNGYLEYIHSTNSMTFGTGGFTRLTLASTGAATFSHNVFVKADDRGYSVQAADGTYNAGLGNLNGSFLKRGYLFLNENGTTTISVVASGSSYFNGGTVVIGSTLSAPTGAETGWWLKLGNRAYFSSSQEALAINRYGSTGTLIAFDYAGSGIGSISYNGTSTILNPTSDQRLKENIVDAGSGLGKLSKIKIRAYDWKESGMHTDFGIVAQEIFEVAPECVSVGNDEIDENGKLKNPWCAQPYVLVSAAVKAIQELNQLVQEQQAIITSLQDRLDKAGL